jgi:hypothetical protein
MLCVKRREAAISSGDEGSPQANLKGQEISELRGG